ncbi:hypothetical protein CBR_g22347 [Chara braunii]|uniref:Uncharacterized protein n=1 Tax=Chara braunii TaxID=69332 RepID=A0A388JUU9_CHABU|nr:hypothetical protein CBR_g22347 [Chara braunii]|eukprot:GBG61550.1 hypothetical protein CBR_g22347 [Chara braunii]
MVIVDSIETRRRQACKRSMGRREGGECDTWSSGRSADRKGGGMMLGSVQAPIQSDESCRNEATDGDTGRDEGRGSGVDAGRRSRGGGGGGGRGRGRGGGDGGQYGRWEFPKDNFYSSSGAGESTGKRRSQSSDKNLTVLPLTSWLTDCLLAAPSRMRTNYFRWCGGVIENYAMGEVLQRPTRESKGEDHRPGGSLVGKASSGEPGNGAQAILSVCEDELARCGTAELTSTAVPALLLPPPPGKHTDERAASLPPLQPFASLFHRYYTLTAPAVTQRLLFGLLNAPTSWVPDSLDAVVQLIEILEGEDGYTSSGKRPQSSWLYVHFLRPIGAAMATQTGHAFDMVTALLFRIFMRQILCFPSSDDDRACGRSQPSVQCADRTVTARGHEHAMERGVAELMCRYGREVELQICGLWESAYGLLPLDKSTAARWKLPINFSDHLHRRLVLLSWSLFRPLLQVLEYLPRGSASEGCVRRIFSATARAILDRTFPVDDVAQGGVALAGQNGKRGITEDAANSPTHEANDSTRAEVDGREEMRAMLRCLFSEACLSCDRAAQLLSDMLAACLSHDNLLLKSSQVRKQNQAAADSIGDAVGPMEAPPERMPEEVTRNLNGRRGRDRGRGAVTAIHSYIVTAVSALACEVQLTSSITTLRLPRRMSATGVRTTGPSAVQQTDASRQAQERNVGAQGGYVSVSGNIPASEMPPAAISAMHTQESGGHHVLVLLERLLSQTPRNISGGESRGIDNSPSDAVTTAAVAVHVSELLRGSRTCMNALVTIMRSCPNTAIGARAQSVIKLIERNSRAAAAAAAIATVEASRQAGAKVNGPRLEDHLPVADEQAFQENCQKTGRVQGGSRLGEGKRNGQCESHKQSNRSMMNIDTALHTDGHTGVGTDQCTDDRMDHHTDQCTDHGTDHHTNGCTDQHMDDCRDHHTAHCADSRTDHSTDDRIDDFTIRSTDDRTDSHHMDHPTHHGMHNDRELRGVGDMVTCDCPMDVVEVGSQLQAAAEGNVQTRSHEGNHGNMDIETDHEDKHDRQVNLERVRKQKLVDDNNQALPPRRPYQGARFLPLDASDMVGLFCQAQQSGATRNREPAAAGWNESDVYDKSLLILLVVEALRNIVIALPQKAAVVIVSQMEADLCPLSGTDDLRSSQEKCRSGSIAAGNRAGGAAGALPMGAAYDTNNATGWNGSSGTSIVNIRIISFLAEMLRLQNAIEALVVIAESTDLLSRATDGLSAATEAFALPQLELLEAALTAMHTAHLIGGTIGDRISTALLRLMKDRLPSIVRCLSVQSTHVRAMSISLLRRLVHHPELCKNVVSEAGGGRGGMGRRDDEIWDDDRSRHGARAQAQCSSPRAGMADRASQDAEGVCSPGGSRCEAENWQRDIQQCILWEMNYRRAGGLSVSLLADAAGTLGCQVSIF